MGKRRHDKDRHKVERQMRPVRRRVQLAARVDILERVRLERVRLERVGPQNEGLERLRLLDVATGGRVSAMLRQLEEEHKGLES